MILGLVVIAGVVLGAGTWTSLGNGYSMLDTIPIINAGNGFTRTDTIVVHINGGLAQSGSPAFKYRPQIGTGLSLPLNTIVLSSVGSYTSSTPPTLTFTIPKYSQHWRQCPSGWVIGLRVTRYLSHALAKSFIIMSILWE